MASNRITHSCPRCDSTKVRTSHRQNALERALSFASIRPFRCTECRFRFWNVTSPSDFFLKVLRRAKLRARIVSSQAPYEWMSYGSAKLRDKSVTNLRGISNWPPTWLAENGTEALTGEIGILKHVITDVRSDKQCFLMIEHGGKTYIGSLKFDSVQSCSLVSKLLKRNIGESIKRIGNLSVPTSL